MRPSLPPGTPIDSARYRDWTNRFGAYRDGVTNLTIDSWLNQFRRDKDLGAVARRRQRARRQLALRGDVE